MQDFSFSAISSIISGMECLLSSLMFFMPNWLNACLSFLPSTMINVLEAFSFSIEELNSCRSSLLMQCCMLFIIIGG